MSEAAGSTEKEAARRSLALADTVAYYAHRRYRELRTEEALADYNRALRACEDALRRVEQAEASLPFRAPGAVPSVTS